MLENLDFTIKELLKIKYSADELNKILDKAENFEGLNEKEVAGLITCENSEIKERIFKIAKKIKSHIYGDRVVMFAPLYVSDYCVNNCSYCGFNCKNKAERKKLTMREVEEELFVLEEMGHKRIALEAGEDPVNCPIEYILEVLRTIYNFKTKNGEIRRANINIASTTVENYKKLHDAGIGTYILFQETYHKESYEKYHLGGPKSNYNYHLTAFDRAMEAGIEDVGAGALFGLYDYKYEILGLLLHNKHLEEKYKVGFHTVSVPRIREAEGSTQKEFEHAIDDETFKEIVAILRLAIPFTGIIISTRENEEMRKTLIDLGISQVSAGSTVEVKGYTAKEKHESQFNVSDQRTPNEVIMWLMEEGLIPSFCTACYRKGRVGDRFMSLAKSGNIKNVCLPNGLLTLKEYAMDYGDEKIKEVSDKLINDKLNDIGNPEIREKTAQYLKDIENGERDKFF